MRGALDGLVTFTAACVLCLLPLNFVLAGVLLLVGVELTDWTLREAERAPLALWPFLASVPVWAAATAYSAWRLLERPLDPRLERWTPRILGTLIYPPLAAHFLVHGPLWSVLAVAAIAAAGFACYKKRPRALDLALLAAISVLHGVLAAILLPGVALPRFMAVAPAVLLVFASWTLLATLLVMRLPKASRSFWC